MPHYLIDHRPTEEKGCLSFRVAGVNLRKRRHGTLGGMTSAKRAVVLLSGGLDSTTTLAIAKAEGYEPYALSFRYGQRHAVEIDSARRIAAEVGVADHRIADIDLRL